MDDDKNNLTSQKKKGYIALDRMGCQCWYVSLAYAIPGPSVYILNGVGSLAVSMIIYVHTHLTCISMARRVYMPTPSNPASRSTVKVRWSRGWNKESTRPDSPGPGRPDLPGRSCYVFEEQLQICKQSTT